ncbi:MAG: circularly permuted type 2 ATP-grasp protein [Acidimicrobiales bacterium]
MYRLKLPFVRPNTSTPSLSGTEVSHVALSRRKEQRDYGLQVTEIGNGAETWAWYEQIINSSVVDVDHSLAWDEVFAAPGVARPDSREIVDVLGDLTTVDLRTRFDQLGRTFAEPGVTFASGGEERPFPLDSIPRIIAASECSVLSAGVQQRVKALEALLDDVYGQGECLNDGLIPRHVVTSSPHVRRESTGIVPRFAPCIAVSGVDIIRDEDGSLRVLADKVPKPSGVSHVVENRRSMIQSFGSLFANSRSSPRVRGSGRRRRRATLPNPRASLPT